MWVTVHCTPAFELLQLILCLLLVSSFHYCSDLEVAWEMLLYPPVVGSREVLPQCHNFSGLEGLPEFIMSNLYLLNR